MALFKRSAPPEAAEERIPDVFFRMRKIVKQYELGEEAVTVLKDIDLEVDRGEVVVVIGPSGSGRSTLCRTINRLEPVD